MSLVFSNLVVKIKATKITAMHNLFANFVKILEVCKHFAQDFVNDKGNMPRPGVVPKFSDLEVIALSLTAETMGIDSECYLFGRLQEYRSQMPNLISRRQFNDRRKLTAGLCEKIRKRIAKPLMAARTALSLTSNRSRSANWQGAGATRWGELAPKKLRTSDTARHKRCITLAIS